jgi:gliding motility-associated-like protein
MKNSTAESNQLLTMGTRAIYLMYSLLLAAGLFFPLTGYTQTINRAEYFIDVDPGNGNATPVTIAAPNAAVNFNFTIPTSVLSNGFHVLGFRFRESGTGFWSHAQYNAFYIVPPVSFPTASILVSGEYFFDADPGFGNGVSIPFAPAPSVSVAVNTINTTSLSPGFHTISFRFRDDQYKWTHALASSFYIVPPTAFSNATSITRAEYFINTDPGAGNGVVLPIAAASPQSNSFAIPLTGLTPGFHKVGFRYRDNLRQWSHADVRTFYIVDATPLTAAQIVRAEYFVDTDPGIGKAASIPGIVAGTTIDQLVALDMTGVSTGSHVLTIRVKDDKGFWSYPVSANFNVSSCIPPAAPIAQSASRCNEGTITLTASGATGVQEYRWYDDPILTTLLSTGSSFTTPVLLSSKNYYASIFDPATSCESSRVTVTAAVTIIPKPIINPSGSVSFCEGSSLFLSAPVGFSQYTWSNGQTTQQILVTTGGDYTVQTGDGTCSSLVSDQVAVTLISAPQKPTISVTGNPTICGTGSVELKGPDGFTYLWSNGASTQSITATQTGVFYLIVKSATGCPSAPSDPVVVTVLSPPCGVTGMNQPPTIRSSPLATQIEGRVEVDLTTLISDSDNNLDFSTLRVINNQTSRGISAIIDASYFLTIDYSGNPFTGTDRVTLEVCDLALACVQQVIDIDVVGSVIVFNGITPDGDGYNDFMLIKYIDVVEGALQNKVTVFNRWGDKVFETENYNNTDRTFYGQGTSGSELPSGTYFYKVEFVNGAPTLTGYLTLLR